MDLPSFEPAFLVLCESFTDVIHECLKLRLEPGGLLEKPSLLSIKQVCLKDFPENAEFLLYFFL